jgi:hypothetical protein
MAARPARAGPIRPRLLVAAAAAAIGMLALASCIGSAGGSSGPAATAGPAKADVLSDSNEASAMPGCGPIPELVDLAEPVPVELQRGPAGHHPILTEGFVVVDLDDLSETLPLQVPASAPGGGTVQLALRSSDDMNMDGLREWIVDVYFGERPPLADESLPQYVDADGAYFQQRQTVGRDAGEILRQLAAQGRTHSHRRSRSDRLRR